MKTRNLQDLKTASAQKLNKFILETEAEIAKLNLDSQKEKSKNVHISRQKRKDIAVAMTILAQKTLEQKPKEVKSVVK